MTSLLLLRVILEFFRGIVRSKRESELSESAQVDETLAHLAAPPQNEIAKLSELIQKFEVSVLSSQRSLSLASKLMDRIHSLRKAFSMKYKARLVSHIVS